MESDRSAPGQTDADPIQKDAKPAEERHFYPSFPSSIEVKFPRKLEERYEANQKSQETRDWWKSFFERLTFLFVVVTIGINWFIYSEMKKSTDATKLAADAAVAATAAWITLERFLVTGIEKDKINFNVIFKNNGKTPALDVQVGFELTFTAPIGPQDQDHFPKYEPYQCPKPSFNPGIIPPDKTWSNVISTSDFYKFSPEEIEMINARTGRAFLHVCATYRDVLSDKERVTEVGGYYPASPNPADMSIAVYHPHSRMK